MKTSLLIGLTFVLFGCVQPSYQRTVIIKLDVSKEKEIKTIGIRGETPLSWKHDVPLEPVIKDSIYTITLTGKTGYLFAECKFVVNGQFELENKQNRKIYFTGDTTYYDAVFDVE
jgi:ribonuclease BN (tRNA processing enzyme)